MDVFRNTAVATTLIVAVHVALVTVRGDARRSVETGLASRRVAEAAAIGAESSNASGGRWRRRGDLDGIREMFEFAAASGDRGDGPLAHGPAQISDETAPTPEPIQLPAPDVHPGPDENPVFASGAGALIPGADVPVSGGVAAFDGWTGAGGSFLA